MSVESALEALHRQFGNSPFHVRDVPDAVARDLVASVGTENVRTHDLNIGVGEWLASHNGLGFGWGTGTHKRLLMLQPPDKDGLSTYAIRDSIMEVAMTVEELGTILRHVIETSPEGAKAVRIVLFGIRYAPELSGVSTQAVCREAGIRGWSEVNKGQQLARYVAIK